MCVHTQMHVQIQEGEKGNSSPEVIIMIMVKFVNSGSTSQEHRAEVYLGRYFSSGE